jgi:hypothetical protein
VGVDPVSHRSLVILVCALLIGTALAQQGQTAPEAPYAGLERRSVKALSDEQIADLRAGRGMGLALPAELNGYPGPVHVLEQAGRLGLSAEQHARVQALYEAMRGEAIPLGERLIAAETDLDRLFAERTVTPDSLVHTTADIGAAQAALRWTAQIKSYAEVRGYSAHGSRGHHSGSAHQKH